MAHLILVFHNPEVYEDAKVWFNTESVFYSDRQEDQSRALYFEDQDLDSLEMALTEELEREGFEGYYFRNDF